MGDDDFENMDDDALLNALLPDHMPKSPRSQAKQLKGHIDSLKNQVKDMYSQGNKKGAINVLRECKVYEKKLKALEEEHPEAVKAVMEQPVELASDATPQPLETPKPEKNVEKIAKNAV